jgi:hypothetical protein
VAAEVPAKPLEPHRANGPNVSDDTESGATRSGLMRSSIVGPREL